MIKELDSVVLAVDLPAHRLKAGEVGTVVHVHGGGKGFEVEFVALDGEPIAVATISRPQGKLAREASCELRSANRGSPLTKEMNRA